MIEELVDSRQEAAGGRLQVSGAGGERIQQEAVVLVRPREPRQAENTVVLHDI